MPQHGRQSGVGLRCGGAFSLNISFGFCLHLSCRRSGFGTRTRVSAYSVPRGTMPIRRCCVHAATERASSGWWSPSSSGRLTSWMATTPERPTTTKYNSTQQILLTILRTSNLCLILAGSCFRRLCSLSSSGFNIPLSLSIFVCVNVCRRPEESFGSRMSSQNLDARVWMYRSVYMMCMYMCLYRQAILRFT